MRAPISLAGDGQTDANIVVAQEREHNVITGAACASEKRRFKSGDRVDFCKSIG
jgi:hypothetical protein